MEKSIFNIHHSRLILTITLLVFVIPIYGQYVSDYIKSADFYYQKADYYSASVYYEKYLEQGAESSEKAIKPYFISKNASRKKSNNHDNKVDIIYRLAESYRHINNYKEAEKWYVKLKSQDYSSYPDFCYWYGVSLRANGKYEEAKTQLGQYITSGRGNYKDQAQQELQNVKFINSQIEAKEEALYKINKETYLNNITGANYAASWNKHTLTFTSTRKDDLAEEKIFNNALYQAKQTSTGITIIEKIDIPTAKDKEQGVAVFNTTGTKLFLTRWSKKNGVNQAAIYVSENKDGNWQAPVLLPEQVNVEGFNAQQPFITKDDKYLIFSSNRPGGFGQYDLWYCPLDTDGKPGQAVNLGNIINSPLDEQSPFYHQSTSTLVFASNGRVGMGGFDLYQSKGNLTSSLTEPVNMGYPVNSIKDDLYFSSKETPQLLIEAFISSDRLSECCLELFSVTKSYKKYVIGKITDMQNKGINGVTIHLKNAEAQLPIAVKTDENGQYSIEMDNFSPLVLTAVKEGFQNATLNFYKPLTNDADTLYNPAISLHPQTAPAKERIAYFEFDKFYLNEEAKLILDKLFNLLSQESGLALEIVGYADEVGSDAYNLKLSESRALACKAYLEAKGINASRLTATGKGECCVSGNAEKDRKATFRLLLVE